MIRSKTITLPPRDREEPGICIPDTPFQKAVIAVGCIVLFFGWMLAVPNV
jgi:nitrogen fixation protein